MWEHVITSSNLASVGAELRELLARVVENTPTLPVWILAAIAIPVFVALIARSIQALLLALLLAASTCALFAIGPVSNHTLVLSLLITTGGLIGAAMGLQLSRSRARLRRRMASLEYELAEINRHFRAALPETNVDVSASTAVEPRSADPASVRPNPQSPEQINAVLSPPQDALIQPKMTPPRSIAPHGTISPDAQPSTPARVTSDQVALAALRLATGLANLLERKEMLARDERADLVRWSTAATRPGAAQDAINRLIDSLSVDRPTTTP